MLEELKMDHNELKEGTCPGCGASGENEEGCPSCPGFWFEIEPITVEYEIDGAKLLIAHEGEGMILAYYTNKNGKGTPTYYNVLDTNEARIAATSILAQHHEAISAEFQDALTNAIEETARG